MAFDLALSDLVSINDHFVFRCLWLTRCNFVFFCILQPTLYFQLGSIV